MNDCLFCRIIAGEIPSRRVYEDEQAVAFLDIEPWHDGHTLLVPRRHVSDLVADPAAWSEVQPALEAVVPRLVQRLAADGMNVVVNAGPVAGQEVGHLHVHLVPRYASAPGMAALMDRDASRDLDELHRLLGEAG
ncbi:MAG: HIT family protein [Actinomycetia bacterium]|nr:HIT family protein [Actinomycetes bacterium]